ncbi:DUF1848 domain-containing protein [uncultured Methanocorpusculum sp.]|nr:DUF1848 domain-containing protein [uncultured Methanocorpusculum sp.]
MILNTGSRTDIPAFFSEWFYNRIREGYVLVRNPYYPHKVTKYLLDPRIVDCINFCTKNPLPMLSRIHELDEFGQFWYVTITPYGKEIEPYVPSVDQVIESFQQLSRIVGLHRIGWRYDPIFLTETYSLEYHIASFEKMAAKLAGYTDVCVISFLDRYEKTRRNFPAGKEVEQTDRLALGKAFSEIGREHRIKIKSCAEGSDLAPFGVDCSGCLTWEVIERAVGQKLRHDSGSTSTRSSCSCLLNGDIGAYNTCGHGCVYCYANYDSETVRHNRSLHDPSSPFLIGTRRDSDVVTNACQIRLREGQKSLF